ncbi:MAG: exodeoxyribonuclease VII large subunit [Desulfobacterales bacterium]|nr:exodeoxyribonuclease VII large subunit [Desulfobacterales bacterium]
MKPGDPDIQKKIFTVSDLTLRLKEVIESNFPFVWLIGEISNFSIPVSGHFYFTLKDKNAQIRAVMFRNQNRNLKFEPRDGMQVTGFGRISLYEPRGTYQVIFEYLEPKGAGALQIAFEQLKVRLSEEGLFDKKFKRPLPFLPKKISVVTSPTGAVIFDIIRVIDRRFPNTHLQVVPVRVQGDAADKEIASAVELVNRQNDSDVIILARGGGSIEDLSPFNSEHLARAIFASHIPIISAVGHETDFTIADFVADLRAPTPSSAAELVVPLKYELSRQCAEYTKTLKEKFNRHLERCRSSLNAMVKRLRDPKKNLQDLRLKINDLTERLTRQSINNILQQRERLDWRTDRLQANTPAARVLTFKERLDQYNHNLFYLCGKIVREKRHQIQEFTGMLRALNPYGILARGYSIARTIPDAVVVRDSEQVRIGQNIKVTLEKGSLICRIERKEGDGKTII